MAPSTEPGGKLHLAIAIRGDWPASPYRRASISASMPAKWRGAKTCAATPPKPNSTHVAAWHWAIRRHSRGRDIGSGIAGGRKFVKPPDRRSAEDAVAGAIRREQSTFVEAVQSVSDFPLDTDEGRDRRGPASIRDHHGLLTRFRCADRRNLPDEAHRAHVLTNLLVRTRDQIDGSSSVGSSV